MKIYIETNSYNIWWGIYGLSHKTGWEDVSIFDQDNNKIGYFCLNTKVYLRHSLDSINIKDEEDRVFKKLTEEYLTDDNAIFGIAITRNLMKTFTKFLMKLLEINLE